ncbi:MAG: ABC transporter ATP-binding protein [Oscillospiraceae bacterium]|jgi:putative ABC transport system ATP-binding protein|nr:ABC transporter ATP-binding protein [Oscillospiraceae bacterium]
MKKLLSMSNIKKSYAIGDNNVSVLKGIDLDINYGEFISIVGSSGSGKTTLMNIIGCLDTPTSGEYILEEDPVSDMNENKLCIVRNKTIGFVFQSFNLIPTLNALENVELPLLYRNISKDVRRKIAKKALEQVGLADRIYHKPCELSGGQQQRVSISRAIVGNPAIILADEPTGNLDSTSSIAILELIESLRNEKKSIILITHDSSIASKSDKIIKIRDGRIDNIK